MNHECSKSSCGPQSLSSTYDFDVGLLKEEIAKQKKEDRKKDINIHLPLKFNNERKTKTRLILHERKLLCTYMCVLYTVPASLQPNIFLMFSRKLLLLFVWRNLWNTYRRRQLQTHLYSAFSLYLRNVSNTIKQHLKVMYFYILNENDLYWQC